MNVNLLNLKTISFMLMVSASYSSLCLGKGENEIGTSFSYFDRQAKVDGEKVQTSEMALEAIYLKSFKSFWSGGELSYLSSRATFVNESYINLGVPFKYWMKGPDSKGIGIYAVATPYFGKSNDSDSSGTIIGFKMGPGIVYFLNDLLGVDSRVFYDYRRTGSNTAVTTGLKIGFSVYF